MYFMAGKYFFKKLANRERKKVLPGNSVAENIIIRNNRVGALGIEYKFCFLIGRYLSFTWLKTQHVEKNRLSAPVSF